MKYLIIGLGNIGDKYEGTRHNAGFQVIDRLSSIQEAEWKLGRHVLRAESKYRSKKLVMIKPTTFMNLSGKAVKYWMEQEKIGASKVLVILDDLHLDFGVVKIRSKGSHAGHNGLKDIDKFLGHNKYPRLRVGIGNNFNTGQQSNYVLGEWSEEEAHRMADIENYCVEAIQSFVHHGISKTMSEFNNRSIEAKGQ